MRRQTLPSGRFTEYGYDEAGRIVTMVYPEAEVRFEYEGTVSGCCEGGPITMVRTPVAGTPQSFRLEYDGSVVTAATWTGAATAQYQYTQTTPDFLPGQIACDGGHAIDIEYGESGLPTRYGPFYITRNGPQARADTITDETLTLEMTYNAYGELTGRSLQIAGAAVYDMQLQYNTTGFITQRTEVLADETAVTWEFAYDADGRLISVTRNELEEASYEYDTNGNRSATTLAGGGTVIEATFDVQDRILQSGEVSYHVDQDGFMVSRAADLFTYSTRGELLSFQPAGGEDIHYDYDALGRRITRRIGDRTWQYAYANLDIPWQATSSRAPDMTPTYFYYDDIGHMFAFQRGEDWYYVGCDQVGTPLIVCAADGTVVRRLVFDAWGNLISDSDPTFELSVGFAGGLADPDTGLVRFGLRDYDSEVGRWTGRDPLLFDGGSANLYVYAQNNPVCLRDPSGLLCVGASGYAVYGGAGQFCITLQGVSWCTALGLGVGSGFSVNPFGNLAREEEYIQAELSANAGIAMLGGQLRFDDCGLRPEGQCRIGPIDCANLGTIHPEHFRNVQHWRDLARGAPLSLRAELSISAWRCRNFRW
jgi:RHS repeat-associated protein